MEPTEGGNKKTQTNEANDSLFVSNSASSFGSSSSGKKSQGKTVKAKRSWLKWLIALVVVLAVAAGLFWLTKTDKLIISFGNYTSFATICDNDVQKKFFDEYNQAELNQENLGSVYKEITSDDKYLDDPNCAYIAFVYGAYVVGDADIAQTAVDALSALSDRSLNPSNTYTTIYQRDIMYNAVKTMKETAPEDALVE